MVESSNKTGHPVVATANKRRICAGNSVLSTDIRVISVQRELSAYRDAPSTMEVGARLHLRLEFSFLLSSFLSFFFLPLFYSLPFSSCFVESTLLELRLCTNASLPYLARAAFARSQRGKFSENARV